MQSYVKDNIHIGKERKNKEYTWALAVQIRLYRSNHKTELLQHRSSDWVPLKILTQHDPSTYR